MLADESVWAGGQKLMWTNVYISVMMWPETANATIDGSSQPLCSSSSVALWQFELVHANATFIGGRLHCADPQTFAFNRVVDAQNPGGEF